MDRLNLKPSRTLTRQIQTIVSTVSKQTETYNVDVGDTKGNNTIPLSATRVDRAELLSVENPNYKELINKYRHLKGVNIEDTDTKSPLPIHLILGASDYTNIETPGPRRTAAIGGSSCHQGQRTVWKICSSLCRMDVLGLDDKPNGDQSVVYEEFLEQLNRSPEGW